MRGAMMRWTPFAFSVVSIASVLVATAAAQTVADAKGKYRLVRLADAPLPASLTDGKGTWTVRDGWLEIYANDSWIFKVGITDPKGSKKARADFGSVTRAGDALTFRSAIYGTHASTLGTSVLELSYDVVGDSAPERLVFARPGQEAAVVAAAVTPAPAASPAGAPQPPAQQTTVPATTPPTPPAATPVQASPDTAKSHPNAVAPNEVGAPPFDVAGTYTDATPLRGATLEIGGDRSWQMHWTHPTGAPGYGGVYFSADHGTLSQAGSRLLFRSAENGDFDARASGAGTIVVDYFMSETPRRWRFVKNGISEDAKNAPTPERGTATASGIKWVEVSAGAYSACALTTEGRAYCWGLSASPDGSSGGSRPAPVSGGLSFASLTVGSPLQCDANRPEQSCENNRAYHVCGVTSTGQGYCWGANRYGQLGDGTTDDSATPVAVGGGLAWTTLSAGEGTTCGITTDHALYCWGRNDEGQLGIGVADNAVHTAPQQVVRDVLSVAAGSNYVCAVRQDGAAYCWGNGGSDRLGTSQAVGYGANPSPLRVESTSAYVAISAGRTHVCAATGSGGAECWGDNYYMESGPGGERRLTHTPTSVGRLALTRVAAGRGFHSCGLTADDAAYCWGLNEQGRLGIGDGSPEPCGYEGRQGCSSAPVAVKAGPGGALRFKSLAVGLEFACGVSTDGDAYCWGDNQRGQLGTGDRSHRSTATPVSSP